MDFGMKKCEISMNEKGKEKGNVSVDEKKKLIVFI